MGNDGNALKAVGQGTGGGAGTNTSGFSALLAGIHYYNGYFNYLGNYGLFRSSTQVDPSFAHCLFLRDGSADIDLTGNHFRGYGFSVRCLED